MLSNPPLQELIGMVILFWNSLSLTEFHLSKTTTLPAREYQDASPILIDYWEILESVCEGGVLCVFYDYVVSLSFLLWCNEEKIPVVPSFFLIQLRRFIITVSIRFVALILVRFAKVIHQRNGLKSQWSCNMRFNFLMTLFTEFDARGKGSYLISTQWMATNTKLSFRSEALERLPCIYCWYYFSL